MKKSSKKTLEQEVQENLMKNVQEIQESYDRQYDDYTLNPEYKVNSDYAQNSTYEHSIESEQDFGDSQTQKESPVTKKSRKRDKKIRRRNNREIAIVFYGFVGIFTALMIYFVVFLSSDNSEILNNPYNKMQDILAQRVQRGSILSSDGKILAETIVDKKGNEVRSYPYDNLFVHTVGQFENGKTGLESACNLYMLTSSTNPIMSAVNELRGEKSKGDNVVTTLNVSLQKIASDSLGSRKGAVIALDPDTGAILAMVSKPDYNPNKVSSIWKDLVNDENSAMLNRATQGLYPPGSTFKYVTLLEYIRENPDFEDFSYKCNGQTTIDDVKVNCYKNKKHGSETLMKAFAKSCNGAFATIGSKLDTKSYIELCNSLLFNQQLPYPYAYKSSSFALTETSDMGEITQTAIGQGKTLISPLHNALLICAAANGGRLVKPYIADRIENVNGREIKSFSYKSDERILTKKEANVLDEYLHDVVDEGTATALNGQSYDAAGKTGSAEFDSTSASHAWFIGYAEKDKKKLAVSIIVEGAGTGSDYAVPIAKKLFDKYY